ncbi:uncharacterized protein FSUBG_13651 [Fusarium subglutinans]|uniref:Uncharacterized protein n=1 Tax=Gibberella subglutinans TaxID=42677 RepID=A0A8H5NU32_GIBSU|nr:uncharacterized protein FSUBG_13651 [Fusarium subglutinans]KAF5579276.1 hypothetical protein FSUBG_13651 [Fusarium subglutinans]
MSPSRKATKYPPFRDIDAWEALKGRDLEYAINLLVSEFNLCEDFMTLIAEYRTTHAKDKHWTQVFKLEDVHVENSARYSSVLKSIIDFMGPHWTTFIASARTLASFSVLGTT